MSGNKPRNPSEMKPSEMVDEFLQLQKTANEATGVRKISAGNELKLRKTAFLVELNKAKGAAATGEHRRALGIIQGTLAPSEPVETGGPRNFASSFAAQANAGKVAEKMVKPTAPEPKSQSDAEAQARALRAKLAGQETEDTQSVGGRSSRADSVTSKASAAAADFSQGVTRAIMHGMQAVADNERLPDSVRSYFREMADGRKFYLGAEKPIKKLDANLAAAVKQTGQAASAVAKDRNDIAAMKTQIKAVITGTRDDLVKGVRSLKTDKEVEAVYTNTLDACRRIWVAEKLGDVEELNKFLKSDPEMYDVKEVVTLASVHRAVREADEKESVYSASSVASAARRKLEEAAETVVKPIQKVGAAVTSKASAAYEALKAKSTGTQQAKPAAAAKTKEDDTGSVASKSSVSSRISQMSQSARDLGKAVYDRLPAAPSLPKFTTKSSQGQTQSGGRVQPESPKQATPPAAPISAPRSSVKAAMDALKQKTEEKKAQQPQTSGRPSAFVDPAKMADAKRKMQETFGGGIKGPGAPVSTTAAPKQTMVPPPTSVAPTLTKTAATQPKPLTSGNSGALAGALGGDIKKKVKGFELRIRNDVAKGENVLDAINDYVGSKAIDDEVRTGVEVALADLGVKVGSSKAAIKSQAPRAPVQAAVVEKPQQTQSAPGKPLIASGKGGMSFKEEMEAKQKAKLAGASTGETAIQRMEREKREKEEAARQAKEKGGGNPFNKGTGTGKRG